MIERRKGAPRPLSSLSPCVSSCLQAETDEGRSQSSCPHPFCKYRKSFSRTVFLSFALQSAYGKVGKMRIANLRISAAASAHKKDFRVFMGYTSKNRFGSNVSVSLFFTLSVLNPLENLPSAVRRKKQKPLKKLKSPVLQKRRGESKAGTAPAFIVSRKGSRGRENELPSPGVLSLFVPFLFARAKRKRTLTGFLFLTGKRKGAFPPCMSKEKRAAAITLPFPLPASRRSSAPWRRG